MKFEHNCKYCVYLGEYNLCDLYYCKGIHTNFIVYRSSNNFSDIFEIPDNEMIFKEFKLIYPQFIEGIKLAYEKGFYKDPNNYIREYINLRSFI